MCCVVLCSLLSGERRWCVVLCVCVELRERVVL